MLTRQSKKVNRVRWQLLLYSYWWLFCLCTCWWVRVRAIRPWSLCGSRFSSRATSPWRRRYTHEILQQYPGAKKRSRCLNLQSLLRNPRVCVQLRRKYSLLPLHFKWQADIPIASHGLSVREAASISHTEIRLWARIKIPDLLRRFWQYPRRKNNFEGISLGGCYRRTNQKWICQFNGWCNFYCGKSTLAGGLLFVLNRNSWCWIVIILSDWLVGMRRIGNIAVSLSLTVNLPPILVHY